MEEHDWDNDADEVRIFVPIAAGIKAKDINYKMVRTCFRPGKKPTFVSFCL